MIRLLLPYAPITINSFNEEVYFPATLKWWTNEFFPHFAKFVLNNLLDDYEFICRLTLSQANFTKRISNIKLAAGIYHYTIQKTNKSNVVLIIIVDNGQNLEVNFLDITIDKNIFAFQVIKLTEKEIKSCTKLYVP